VAVRKPVYHPLVADGCTLFVVKPCRNLGASCPERERRRRFERRVVAEAGGGGWGDVEADAVE